MAAARRVGAALVGLALAVVPLLSGCGQDHHVVLTVTPSASRADDAAVIRASGLAPGSDAGLSVDATDAKGTAWRSAVTLRADDQGDIDTATASASTGGSYAGVFADGLIAMLSPADGAAPASFAFPASGSAEFRFSVTVDGKVAASTVQQRALADPGVTTTTYRSAEHGFDGVYARPSDTSSRRPAVLLLGGSEGGNSQVVSARLLAAHGIPALALAYFNSPDQPDAYPDLPKSLKDVPLEYFRTALTWLATQPGVDADHVRVDGASRGSEAALLSAIEFPDLVHGVVAVVPTNAARPALVVDGGRSTGDREHAAWTYRGREIPWTNQTGVDASDRPAALFAAEEIDGPVLLVCGEADQVWQSCPFSRQLDARLTGAGFRFAHQVLSYPDGGHFVSLPANLPLVPDPHGLPVYGSTAQADPLASADAWPRTVAFLQST